MAAPAPDCSIPDSPTRAPAGWSLSLSRMRAQRAEEEQGLRGAAADGRQKMLSDREEGELPDTPPRKSVPATPSAVSMNDDLQEYRLKVAALENQVCSLRRANGDLARRLAAAEIEEGAAAENRPKAELAALQKKNEALQKEADVASAKVCFLRMVNAGSSETREHVEAEVFSLRKANADLTRRLAAAETFSAAAKSRHTEELAALKKKNDTLQRNVAEAMVKLSRLADSKATAASNVENLKKKVENQRQNLTNLQHTLMKYKGLQAATFLFQTKSEPVRECGTESGRGLSKDACASCARLHGQIGILLGENATMKTRISNQTSALALKEAALKRAKNESAAKACSSTTAVAGQRRDLGSAPRPTATSAPQQQECMPMDESGAYPFEKKVFKVLLDVFPMAGNIMQSFEESSRSLTALRPAFRAAIAAMPPATRMLTTSKLGPMLPQPAALLAGAGPWTEDPALEGNDAALMAVFWGRRDACQLLGCKADARLWSQPLGAPGHRGGAAGPKREAPGTLADTPSAVARSAQRREASIAAPASGSPTHVPPVPERKPPLVPAPEAVWKTPVVPALEPVLKTPLVPAPEPVLLPPKPGPSKEAPLVRVTKPLRSAVKQEFVQALSVPEPVPAHTPSLLLALKQEPVQEKSPLWVPEPVHRPLPSNPDSAGKAVLLDAGAGPVPKTPPASALQQAPLLEASASEPERSRKRPFLIPKLEAAELQLEPELAPCRTPALLPPPPPSPLFPIPQPSGPRPARRVTVLDAAAAPSAARGGTLAAPAGRDARVSPAVSSLAPGSASCATSGGTPGASSAGFTSTFASSIPSNGSCTHSLAAPASATGVCGAASALSGVAPGCSLPGPARTVTGPASGSCALPHAAAAGAAGSSSAASWLFGAVRGCSLPPVPGTQCVQLGGAGAKAADARGVPATVAYPQFLYDGTRFTSLQANETLPPPESGSDLFGPKLPPHFLTEKKGAPSCPAAVPPASRKPTCPPLAPLPSRKRPALEDGTPTSGTNECQPRGCKRIAFKVQQSMKKRILDHLLSSSKR